MDAARFFSGGQKKTVKEMVSPCLHFHLSLADAIIGLYAPLDILACSK